MGEGTHSARRDASLVGVPVPTDLVILALSNPGQVHLAGMEYMPPALSLPAQIF